MNTEPILDDNFQPTPKSKFIKIALITTTILLLVGVLLNFLLFGFNTQKKEEIPPAPEPVFLLGLSFPNSLTPRI